MPSLESNLLYATAQQRNRGERELRGERRGTGGRSSIYRRPLCLYMTRHFLFAALAALLAGSLDPASAQDITARKNGFQIRIGAMGFTPLVRDGVRSSAVEDSITADQSDDVSVRQQIAPAITIAALLPLRARTELELSATVASSALQGEDDFGTWDMGTVTLANALIGVSYAYRPSLLFHGGAGLTKLFSAAEGLFAKGSGMHPLLEAGMSWVTPIHSAFQLDARAQMHPFATESLRDEAGQQGGVFRVVVTGSYTVGRSAR